MRSITSCANINSMGKIDNISGGCKRNAAAVTKTGISIYKIFNT